MLKINIYILLIALSVIFITYCSPTSTIAKSAIPPDNLAYPVLIILSDHSSATAFYLKNDKHVYLVTAKHVLFADSQEKLKSKTAICLSYPEDIMNNNKIKVVVDINSLNSQGLIKSHHTHDVVILQIGNKTKGNDDVSSQFEFNKGVLRILEPNENTNIVVGDVNNTKSFDDILISNDIFIFGYPTSIGFKNEFEKLRPLLRKGIVAGKNLTNETIILDCPTYGGNSGGPVIEVDNISLQKKRYIIIGVLSKFIPYTEIWENKTNKLTHLEVSNSGYSVVTPIDKVLELINQFEKSEDSNTIKDSGQK